MILTLSAAVFTAVASVRMLTQLRAKADEAKELGRYRLKEKIGSGGMGDVYLAEHRLMKRPCAIKVIRPEKAGDPRAIARFEREVQATSKLNHWNNVSIYDYGRTRDGKFFYVMEYLSGLSLQELVKRKGPLAPARTVYLLRQICNALMEAHQIQLVHRDIKPANVIVTELGGEFDVAKLLDFGLAKPIAASQDEAQVDETGLTVAGALTGSPLYIAPEQALGDSAIDHRSDIYGVGGLAFYLLTGRPPFHSGPTLKILLAHLNEQPVAPSEVRAQEISNRHGSHPGRSACPISPDLDRVVLRCLSKRPEDRYQSARELRDALEALPEGHYWNGQRAKEWWNSNCTHYQSENG
jgi:serine/threonine-protein kinase